MGRELECRVRVGRRMGSGIARLESEELLFRGDFRLRIPFREIQGLEVRDSDLVVTHSEGTARFALGDQATAWAEKIRTPRSLLDKLGVRAGMRVAVLGVDDSAFGKEIAARAGEVTRSRPRKGSDLILLAADAPVRLARLRALRDAIRPQGAIWVVWPKGQPGLREDDVRAEARRVGLVDIKVVAFSPTHSALKLVIPVAQRR